VVIDTDDDLLAQIRKGNREAVEQLYRRHGPHVLALITRVVGDYQLAEEAVQDTFLAVWTDARFEGRSQVRTWLVGIALRQAGSKRRKRTIPVTQLVSDVISIDVGPEDSAVNSVETARLLSALAELTQRQREVLLLAFVEQLTQSEIAVVLGIRLGTVKSRMHGARHALERRWQEEGLS
jgi:RNA polymerase sigma factor (sigma-70 family)